MAQRRVVVALAVSIPVSVVGHVGRAVDTGSGARTAPALVEGDRLKQVGDEGVVRRVVQAVGTGDLAIQGVAKQRPRVVVEGDAVKRGHQAGRGGEVVERFVPLIRLATFAHLGLDPEAQARLEIG